MSRLELLRLESRSHNHRKNCALSEFRTLGKISFDSPELFGRSF